MRRIGHAKWWAAALVAALVALVPLACGGNGNGGAAGNLEDVARERGLSEADLLAAAKTYVPTGKMDEYTMFASGGHSGQVLVIGMPSMRLLKVIGVFTPEPWQGYGYGAEEHDSLFMQARMGGKEITWGDTHHPALSETDGDYDGQWLFINDKANPRVAVIDLRDYETKQIVGDELLASNHGGSFVTPNTEYVIVPSQYAGTLDGSYASLDEYEEKYRGAVTFWKFDRERGRIDEAASFTIELPPYWQDLSDAGKGPSHGWAFINTFNTEMATGGIEKGNPPFEAGASANDMDYLTLINWERAAEIVEAGDTTTIQGRPVIMLQTAIDEGILYLAPEPKSPHGVDVTPDGTKLVISGKLDPHATVYSWQKIQDAIAAGTFSGTDDYGIPILDFDSVIDGQVELGLGPLHSQFGTNGDTFTSLFLESAVAKWNWQNLSQPVEKLSVHYNVGHLAAAEGDTKSPDGKYLVSLNKWAIDRFQPVGPLHPQNFQLIDISTPQMSLLYDMPVGIGEPHYAQIIKSDKLSPWTTYPQVGFDPGTMEPKTGEFAQSGNERIERRGNEVHVFMTSIRSHFTPEHIEVNRGDRVVLHITNVEQAQDATHGFAIDKYNVNLSLEPGESQTVRFTADRAGIFPYYCTEFCSALHLEMAGYMLVRP